MNQANLSIAAPSEDQPLRTQFEFFLDQFNRIVHSVFTLIAASSQPSQASSSSAASFHHTDQLPIVHEILSLERYLYGLLEIHLKHHLNCRKIQNCYLTLNNLDSNHFKENLNLIFHFQKKLDRICLDGKNEKIQFKKLNDLSLTPNQIMSYARLIAPYTAAPPAPPTTNQEQPINPSTGLDLQDPTLRFLMPFPTEDVMRRGRMGQEMLATGTGENVPLENGTEIGALLGELRSADGARPNQANPQFPAYPTMPPRRAPPPPMPEAEDDLFDLDLNPDL